MRRVGGFASLSLLLSMGCDGTYAGFLNAVPVADERGDQPVEVFADELVARGFHIPGLGDSTSSQGFHGSLTAGSSRSVLASEGRPLPALLRADDLLRVLPELAPPTGL